MLVCLNWYQYIFVYILCLNGLSCHTALSDSHKNKCVLWFGLKVDWLDNKLVVIIYIVVLFFITLHILPIINVSKLQDTFLSWQSKLKKGVDKWVLFFIYCFYLIFIADILYLKFNKYWNLIELYFGWSIWPFAIFQILKMKNEFWMDQPQITSFACGSSKTNSLVKYLIGFAWKVIAMKLNFWAEWWSFSY